MGLRVILSRLSLKKFLVRCELDFLAFFSLTDLPRIRQADSTQDDGVRTFYFRILPSSLISYFGFYPIYHYYSGISVSMGISVMKWVIMG
jgi:hypothetical protein